MGNKTAGEFVVGGVFKTSTESTGVSLLGGVIMRQRTGEKLELFVLFLCENDSISPEFLNYLSQNFINIR